MSMIVPIIKENKTCVACGKCEIKLVDVKPFFMCLTCFELIFSFGKLKDGMIDTDSEEYKKWFNIFTNQIFGITDVSGKKEKTV